MVTIHPEYVVDKDKHPRAVLLPISEWEKVMEELEELDDIRAYDKTKESAEDSIPLDQAVREIQEGHDA
jgi:PHD/YefM family antitoxin component YafN of YafNO toxin-antitoxin module